MLWHRSPYPAAHVGHTQTFVIFLNLGGPQHRSKFDKIWAGLGPRTLGAGARGRRGARGEERGGREGGGRGAARQSAPPKPRPPPAAMPVYSRLVQDIDIEEETEIQHIDIEAF